MISTGWNGSSAPGVSNRAWCRVIPGVEAATHALPGHRPRGSKFGLLPDDAREAIARRTSAARC